MRSVVDILQQHDVENITLCRALREQVLKQAQDNPEEAAAGGPTLYKGLNNYTDYKQGFRREQTIGSEKGGGAHGPLRASQHVRTTVIFDYKPDICKDYKETGYCGYGDACKFVHDRGDYKSGWELEKVSDSLAKMHVDGDFTLGRVHICFVAFYVAFYGKSKQGCSSESQWVQMLAYTYKYTLS